MNRIVSYLGPRGWAALTLAGGAALASPFLHPVQPEPSDLSVTATAPRLAGSETFVPQATTAVNGKSSSESGLSGRVVSGVLPATLAKPFARPFNGSDIATPPALPEWVRQRSPLDELIASGLASDAPVAENETKPGELRQLRAWRGPGLPQGLEPRTAASARPMADAGDAPWDAGPAREPERATADETLATTWPDQSLEFDWEELDPNRRPPAEPRQTQRTVAAPLHRPHFDAASPSETIGAKLLRAERATTPAQSPTSGDRPAANHNTDGSRFVYQPGLDPLGDDPR